MFKNLKDMVKFGSDSGRESSTGRAQQQHEEEESSTSKKGAGGGGGGGGTDGGGEGPPSIVNQRQGCHCGYFRWNRQESCIFITLRVYVS